MQCNNGEKIVREKTLILSLSHTNIVFLFVVDTKLGDIGYRFRKEFKGCEIVEGQVIDVLEGTHLEKNRRCIFANDDKEDLSLTQISHLNKVLNSDPIIKSTKMSKETNKSFKHHYSIKDGEKDEKK